MDYIPYGKQYIDQEDIDAVVEVLKSDWLTQGPKVIEFENMVAEYHNCKYAVAFCNGTAALHGAYYVSTKFPFGKKNKTIEDLNKFTSYKYRSYQEYEKFKDQYWEFITTPLTFVATSNAGLYCGGSPKFTDIDFSTYCIDIEKIEDSITEDTRVITPVSYAGYPVDIKTIKDLPKVKENNICVIHDACHALGARRDGHGIADFADMTVLSFHPVKHITTGEGGMLLTNNEEYYNKLLLFRNHGITKDKNMFDDKGDGDWYYEMQELGYNYRITDIQCVLGISQMKKLDSFLYRRNQVAKKYEEILSDLESITLPPTFNKNFLDNIDTLKNEKPFCLHSYHLFPIKTSSVEMRHKLFDTMRNNGIGVQVHYIPVNKQRFYKDNFSDIKQCIIANDLYDKLISLPIFYSINDENIENIVSIIKNHQR